MPTVGDEIVVRARVSEFFSMTQLSGASQVTKLASDVPAGEVQIDDATPPSELAAAERFWERHEGMQLRVRAGSGAVSGRNVFGGTADAEIWVIDKDDPLLAPRRPVRTPGVPRRAPAGQPAGHRRRRQRRPHPARFDRGQGDRRRQRRSRTATRTRGSRTAAT
nr:hypothetical protein GCM10020092_009300 [Actinoplanes digitatis]